MQDFMVQLVRDLLPVGVIAAVDIAGVLVATVLDFVSGICRASRTGQRRTSRRFRRTVTKVLSYLLLLFGMLSVDGIIVLTMLLSNAGNTMVIIPCFTTTTAICLTLIEAKSISENVGSGRLFDDIMGLIKRVKFI